MSTEHDIVAAVAEYLEVALNPDRSLKRVGFAIITFDFGGPGVSNYVSNAERADMVRALREMAYVLESNNEIDSNDRKAH